MASHEGEKELAKKLAESLEAELKDIEHIRRVSAGWNYLNEVCTFWEYGDYKGKICIIGEIEDGTVILDLNRYIESSDVSQRTIQTHSPRSMRTALEIFGIVEKYLMEHGEEHKSMYRDKRGFYFRNGIPEPVLEKSEG